MTLASFFLLLISRQQPFLWVRHTRAADIVRPREQIAAACFAVLELKEAVELLRCSGEIGAIYRLKIFGGCPMARSMQAQDLDTRNAVSIAGYLSEAFKTGDGKTIARAMGVVARARGMTQLAKDTGLERANLYRSLKGNPKLSTTMKLLDSFNMQVLVVPKRKRA